MAKELESGWKREDCYFDKVQGEFVVRHLIESKIRGKVLDIACGDGLLTTKISEIPTVKSICGLDAFEEAVAIAKQRQYKCPVSFTRSFFEDFPLNEKYDSITAINILEHVNDHVSFLKQVKAMLSENGRAFIYVPNADSLHVLLAVKMGVIPDKYYLNRWQKEFVGHTIHYDMDLMMSHATKAGLKIVDSGSIIFKPFSNSQLDYLLSAKDWDERTDNNAEVRGWAVSRQKLFDGLYDLCKMPELNKYGSTLYMHCTA
ncbi:class I SAM-dependent methyltransferase [Candidatus Margulisiibacteriota bacterium]